MSYEIPSRFKKFTNSPFEDNRFIGECGSRRRMSCSPTGGRNCYKCGLDISRRPYHKTMHQHQQIQQRDANIAVREAYSVENSTDLIGSPGVRTLYAIPVEYDSGLNSPVAYKSRCDVHENNPMIYQNAIHSRFPINFQDAALDLSIPNPQVSDKNDNKNSSLETVSSYKKPIKGKHLQKSTSGGKWKKAYHKGVIKKKKSDNEKLVLLGPQGPVLYAKVANNILTMSMKSLKITSDRENAIIQNTETGGSGDATSFISESPDQILKMENQGKIAKSPQCEISVEYTEKKDETSKIHEVVDLKKNEGVLREEIECGSSQLEYRRISHDDTNHSWVELNTSNGGSTETKQIYRAKMEKGYNRISSSSLRTFATENGSHSKSNRNDKLRILKEAMPSIVAKSKSDHSKQLKECVESYVNYLVVKNDLENGAVDLSTISNGRSDSSTTQVGSRKLIDIVSKPLYRLPSDVTLTVTQSVTDALISADEPEREHKLSKCLKELKEKQFKKLQEELDALHAIIRCDDSITAT